MFTLCLTIPLSGSVSDRVDAGADGCTLVVYPAIGGMKSVIQWLSCHWILLNCIFSQARLLIITKLECQLSVRGEKQTKMPSDGTGLAVYHYAMIYVRRDGDHTVLCCCVSRVEIWDSTQENMAIEQFNQQFTQSLCLHCIQTVAQKVLMTRYAYMHIDEHNNVCV